MTATTRVRGQSRFKVSRNAGNATGKGGCAAGEKYASGLHVQILFDDDMSAG
ncbi:hypothetical protein AA23498_0779 [Acetobacter nitrogenifigens DSM 23921 = NBRC 105050]|uniref:Uncharacterized protein n=1 Tax=Acetobacter nitrogenifigens DSM 23921 = NBRC 105050 TaxID=1120919 RepID=A0A511XD86_9PROT|nr:hypothetical protein AA23498_0779 [Acetobacter nitrogenifigens DSM 23921 = NBRC 105050]GEN60918.1 hypothetical protein ANI02nite_28020 [Acetobacter nitrogenifigens DSM 23921 = NBRC 105050]